MTHPADFRALCAELEKECFSMYAEMSATQDFSDSYLERMDELRDRARAALAVPQHGAPSGEDLHAAYDKGYMDAPTLVETECHYAGLRAVLTRYGTQPAPVPVSERLPEEGDCAPWPDDPDTQDWCWAGVVVDGGWEWHQRSPGIFTFIRDAYTHWLPCWALPLPEAQP